jgi:hypothetical protein
MPRDWIIKVESNGASSSSYTLQLGVKDPETGKMIDFTMSCHSVEEFEKELAFIKVELDGLAREAAEAVKRFQHDSKDHVAMDPGQVWHEMEHFASEEEMFTRFNSLSENDRKIVADYIFTHVNMFRGRGAVFAEHYDSDACTLER